MTVTHMIWAIVVFFVAYGCYFGFIGFFGDKKHEAAKTSYADRRQEFLSNMDERQYKVYQSWRGEPYIEVYMSMEKRIYELEQRLLDAEHRNIDDGK